VPSKLWQYVLALHRTLKYRILHGNATNNLNIEIKKGLTEGGRLSPLLWGLYVANLVTQFRDFPELALPSPYALTILGILLYVDDFCLTAISAAQLLSMMQTTQNWCECNQLTINSDKSKVMVSHKSTRPQQLAELGVWLNGQSAATSLRWHLLSLFEKSLNSFILVSLSILPSPLTIIVPRSCSASRSLPII
jgi:hypothetical protein